MLNMSHAMLLSYVQLKNIDYPLRRDFTLYKAPAPPEYNGLGDALSKRRRAAAEDGNAHVVARKLGRLFHKFLPSVPKLISAYGQRASEIANSKFANSRGNRADGVFVDYVGPDGTSIWAAATSSPDAICVHLLACMLARIWPAPQAIAICFELITERQAELAKLSPDDPLHISDIAPARLTLTREDLAQWDASARAWLSIADAAMKKEQTRLMLLVDKTKLLVDFTKGVYLSVMNVWVTALTVIDKILGGMSHDVQGGGVLLGLASWHLFPDMHIITKSVAQHDSTIPNAGILTFGIERPSIEADDGIHWSLPLAHLRYYGQPVRSVGNMGTRSLRLSTSEFHLFILGGVIARMGRYGQDVLKAADLISSMWKFLLTSAQSVGNVQNASSHHFVADFPKMNTWFKLLADAADDLLSSSGLERQAQLSLVERGSRRYEGFLAPIQSFKRPLFNISKGTALIPMLTEEGAVRLLHRVIRGANLKPDQVIIRYWHKAESVDRVQEGTAEADLPDVPEVFLPNMIAESGLFTAVEPFAMPAEAQSRSVSPTFWFPGGLQDYKGVVVEFEGYVGPPSKNAKAQEPIKRPIDSTILRGSSKRRRTRAATRVMQEEAILKPNTNTVSIFSEATSRLVAASTSKEFRPWIAIPRKGDFEYASALLHENALASTNKHEADEKRYGHVRWVRSSDPDHLRQTLLVESGETVREYHPTEIVDEDDASFKWTTDSPNGFDDSFYVYVFGVPNIGAIYRRIDAEIDISDELELQDIKDAMENQSVRSDMFLDHLCETGRNPDERDHRIVPTFVRSLQAIAAASTVYKLMPNATVTTGILSSKIYEAKWIPESRKIFKSAETLNAGKLEWLSAYILDRSSTFACIAMFENANINLDPKGLDQVMALSTANSIYVAMPLLCDPFKEPEQYEIRHVVGNFGQPDISFLIPPPPKPIVRKVDEERWAIVNHAAFDENYEDHFQSTSMHLSFTKLSIPAGLDHSSGQDIEACFRQTLVSLVDSKGKWVADLDILGALENPLFQRIKRSQSCRHAEIYRKKPCFQLKSIDNWDEFLDRPRCPAIFRARGNWLARLAAAALNVRMEFPTLVLDPGGCESEATSQDPDICWACVTDRIVEKKDRKGKTKDVSNSYDATEVPYVIA